MLKIFVEALDRERRERLTWSMVREGTYDTRKLLIERTMTNVDRQGIRMVRGRDGILETCTISNKNLTRQGFRVLPTEKE